MKEAVYQRPVKARLAVLLPDGEMWDATAADVAKFGLVDGYEGYIVWEKWFRALLTDAGLLPEGAIVDAMLNAVRYSVECAFHYPDLLDHPDNQELWSRIVRIERFLQQHQEEVGIE